MSAGKSIWKQPVEVILMMKSLDSGTSIVHWPYHSSVRFAGKVIFALWSTPEGQLWYILSLKISGLN